MNFKRLKYKLGKKFDTKQLPFINENSCTKLMDGYDFSDIDLSYLTIKDFSHVEIRNCNFRNSHISLNFNDISYPPTNLVNVVLDGGIILCPETIVDSQTIALNENYPFTPQQYLISIIEDIENTSGHIHIFDPAIKKPDELLKYVLHQSESEYRQSVYQKVEFIVKKLKSYNQDELVSLINKLIDKIDIEYVFYFLMSHKCRISNLVFQNIDFTKKETEILSSWYINNVNEGKIVFDNCTFAVSYSDAQTLFASTNYKSTILNNSLWGETIYKNSSLTINTFSNNGVRKIPGSEQRRNKQGIILTCNTSAYIKLGNACNGKCSFCKNKTETPTDTNVQGIVDTLCDSSLGPHLNQIFLGGGEPSLYLSQIKEIISKYIQEINKKIDLFMFTNGSGNWQQINDILNELREKADYLLKWYIIISRHAIEDNDNYEITGVNYSLEDSFLQRLMERNYITFALACTEKNIHSNFLDEYLRFGAFYNINNFIIQNLEAKTEEHQPSEIELQFQELENRLLKEGYEQSRIISSAYFSLNLYKNRNKSITLKRYFDPSLLEEQYRLCPKHSYDLGIDSDGSLYNDFQMQKLLKRK